MSAQHPLEYTLTITGTGLVEWGGTGKFGVIFGFDASQVLFVNNTAGNVYVSLASTAGSTGGFCLYASEALSMSGIQTGSLSYATTTTSTAQQVRVGAWRW